MQRVGTPLLGAVVLPRLNNLRVSEPTAPAVTLTAPDRPALDQGDGIITDADLTQPMRFPTNTRSAADKAREKAAKAANEKTAQNAQVRPRTGSSADEVTAVIDMSGSGLVKEGAKAEDGDGK